MITRKTDLLFSLALAAFLGGCSSAALPEPKLTSAKTAVSAAEAVGAVDEPKAALHLTMAQDGIVEAEKAIADHREDDAIPILERALDDAELASALTAEAENRRSAEAATARLVALQTSTSPEGN